MALPGQRNAPRGKVGLWLWAQHCNPGSKWAILSLSNKRRSCHSSEPPCQPEPKAAGSKPKAGGWPGQATPCHLHTSHNQLRDTHLGGLRPPQVTGSSAHIFSHPIHTSDANVLSCFPLRQGLLTWECMARWWMGGWGMTLRVAQGLQCWPGICQQPARVRGRVVLTDHQTSGKYCGILSVARECSIQQGCNGHNGCARGHDHGMGYDLSPPPHLPSRHPLNGWDGPYS